MDDNQALYAPDTTTRLIELFKKQFADYFKSYWEASPSSPPIAADYPALIIQKLKDKAVLGPTSTDDLTERMGITVMLNKADDLGSANVKTTTMRSLEHLIEGQDPTTLQYKSDTIFFVLRTYLTLLQSSGSIWLIDSDVEVTYDQVPQKDAPTIAIASIIMTTQRRVIVSRSG